MFSMPDEYGPTINTGLRNRAKASELLEEGCEWLGVFLLSSKQSSVAYLLEKCMRPCLDMLD